MKIAGMAIVVVALAAVFITGAMARSAGVASLVYALPVMVGGAAIYALGAILEALVAIQKATEACASAVANAQANNSHRGQA